MMADTMDLIFKEIVSERYRAHVKHGTTSMESCDPLADRRLRVLVEEVGEVARALNDREHADPSLFPFEVDASATAQVRRELIQVAAMAVAWIAAIDGEAY
jgi:NTP pyrophosphatase (non-canonical NTP hydrolase)